MSIAWPGIDARWDWRLSAHWRIGSLASAWLLALVGPALGPIMLPVFGARFVASTAQTVLNARLGRKQPLGQRPLLDWGLLGLALLASCAIAWIHDTTGASYSFLLVLPVIVPFSAIQVRTAVRCYAQSREQPEPATVIQLGDRRRAASKAA